MGRRPNVNRGLAAERNDVAEQERRLTQDQLREIARGPGGGVVERRCTHQEIARKTGRCVACCKIMGRNFTRTNPVMGEPPTDVRCRCVLAPLSPPAPDPFAHVRTTALWLGWTAFVFFCAWLLSGCAVAPQVDAGTPCDKEAAVYDWQTSKHIPTDKCGTWVVDATTCAVVKQTDPPMVEGRFEGGCNTDGQHVVMQ